MKRMACCGAPILWTRPFQCVHEWEAFDASQPTEQLFLWWRP